MSLTTTDKQNIKGMISEGVEKSPVINSIKDNLDGLEGRVYKVEVLLEDTNVTVKQMLGMLSDSLKVKPQLNDHEVRITEIEAIQPMIISTVALHSKRLKA